MPYETRDGEGSLFVNERKASDKHPDYRGEVRIAGVLYRLSGWKRTSKAGTRWLALKVSQDGERTEPKPAGTPQHEEPDDDPLPF